MKQKVVISVSMGSQRKSIFGGCIGTQICPDENKSRCKALQIVVGVQGVESAALKGDGKDSIEVVGEFIDAVALTTLLRKKLGNARIVSVGPAEEKKATTEEKKDEILNSLFWHPQPSYQYYEVPSHEPYCSIL